MQRFIELDHIGTRWGIAFGAHLRRSSHRHVDRCLVPTVVMAASRSNVPCKCRMLSHPERSSKSSTFWVACRQYVLAKASDLRLVLRSAEPLRSQYQSRTARGLSWNPCGVAYFSTSTWFHRPSLVRKAEIPLSTLRPAPLNTIGTFAFWHHSCAVFMSSSEYGLWWRILRGVTIGDTLETNDHHRPKFTGFDLPV